jgi:isopenicillin N synthase-like dioxygenase
MKSLKFKCAAEGYLNLWSAMAYRFGLETLQGFLPVLQGFLTFQLLGYSQSKVPLYSQKYHSDGNFVSFLMQQGKMGNEKNR